MFVFPVHLLNPASIKAGVVGRVISGGEALNGETDAIETDGGGRWEITFSGITLRTLDQRRLWEAWGPSLTGARRVLVPIVSPRTAPRPVAGGRLATPSPLVANDPVFPTSVTRGIPYMVGTVVSNAALRATTLVINVSQGAISLHADALGIGGRAYKIERVQSRTGQQATVTISPPLRAAVTAGTAINFDWPVVQCVARIGQDLTPEVQYGDRAEVSISFVEDFADAG